MQRDGKINTQTHGWWAARVTFPDGEVTDIITSFTNEPDMYRHGLERTYITATVEVWEVDANGNPIGKGQPEAVQAAAKKEADDAIDSTANEAQEKAAKRPSGMAEWFTT